MPVRVVLADDHILVRQALKSLLEREGIQVVGEASVETASAGGGRSDTSLVITLVERAFLCNALENAGDRSR